MTQFDYLFGSLDYDNDRFSGVTERTTEGVGYGRHLLRGPTHLLDAELGAGATQQKLATGERSEALVGLFNAKYQWRISDSSSFTQTVKVEESSDNTFINPISELKLVIAGNLFTTLGYEIRSNSQVPDVTAPKSKPQAIHRPKGVTSANPHRLISAVMRLGDSASVNFFPITA